MQTVYETRRSRLRLLLNRYKTYAQLNEALEWPRTDSRLSRIRNANVRSDRAGKVFQMGDNIAREIEAKLSLPEGWMDTPPSYAELHGEFDPRAKAEAMLAAMDGEHLNTAIRLLDALTKQPEKNGTAH